MRECEGRGPRIFTQSWKGTHLPVEAMNDPRTCSCYMYLEPPRNHERDYLRVCLYACRRVYPEKIYMYLLYNHTGVQADATWQRRFERSVEPLTAIPDI